MRKTLLAAIAVASMSTFNAHAMDDDGKFYVGANYAAFNYKEGSVDLDLPVIYGRIGAFMTDNLSAEFRYGVAAGDDSVDLGGVSGDVEVSEYYEVRPVKALDLATLSISG